MADLNINKSDTVALLEDVGQNLVIDGNMEGAPSFTAAQTTNSAWIDGTATGSATNDASGWYVSSSSGIPTTWAVQFDSTTSNSGTYSLQINVTSTAVNKDADVGTVNTSRGIAVNHIHQLIPLYPSTSYRLSYAFKYSSISNSNAQGVRIRFGTYTSSLASDNAALYQNGYLTGTAGWATVTTTFTTSSVAVYGAFYAYIQGETGTLWIDDVSLQVSGANQGKVDPQFGAVVTPGIQNISGPKIWS